jgi:hypothetical protein
VRAVNARAVLAAALADARDRLATPMSAAGDDDRLARRGRVG